MMNKESFVHYKTNIEILDDEHWTLFELVNAINDASRKKKSDAVLDLLAELQEKTKLHHLHEEQYMESIDYPFIKAHKETHKKIEAVLNEIVMRSSKNLDTLWMSNKLELMKAAHIDHDDMQLTLHKGF